MTLEERRQIYVLYLYLKIEEQDWHGASDACNDLRELEVELAGQGRGIRQEEGREGSDSVSELSKSEGVDAEAISNASWNLHRKASGD